MQLYSYAVLQVTSVLRQMTLQSHDGTRWPSRLRIIVGILDRVSRMTEHAGPVDSACDLSEVGIAVVGLTKLQWCSVSLIHTNC